MRVLVVGGAGFIGQALISRMLQGAGVAGQGRATQITNLDQRIGEQSGDPRLRCLEGSITNREVLGAAIAGGVDLSAAASLLYPVQRGIAVGGAELQHHQAVGAHDVQ